jgi:hypothetical protein
MFFFYVFYNDFHFLNEYAKEIQPLVRYQLYLSNPWDYELYAPLTPLALETYQTWLFYMHSYENSALRFHYTTDSAFYWPKLEADWSNWFECLYNYFWGDIQLWTAKNKWNSHFTTSWTSTINAMVEFSSFQYSHLANEFQFKIQFNQLTPTEIKNSFYTILGHRYTIDINSTYRQNRNIPEWKYHNFDNKIILWRIGLQNIVDFDGREKWYYHPEWYSSFEGYFKFDLPDYYKEPRSGAVDRHSNFPKLK